MILDNTFFNLNIECTEHMTAGADLSSITDNNNSCNTTNITSVSKSDRNL